MVWKFTFNQCTHTMRRGLILLYEVFLDWPNTDPIENFLNQDEVSKKPALQFKAGCSTNLQNLELDTEGDFYLLLMPVSFWSNKTIFAKNDHLCRSNEQSKIYKCVQNSLNISSDAFFGNTYKNGIISQKDNAPYYKLTTTMLVRTADPVPISEPRWTPLKYTKAQSNRTYVCL